MQVWTLYEQEAVHWKLKIESTEPARFNAMIEISEIFDIIFLFFLREREMCVGLILKRKIEWQTNAHFHRRKEIKDEPFFGGASLYII